MSSLSSGKLKDIKYLYENVVSGNQEVLSEGPYGADSVRAAQEAARKRDEARSNKEKATNTAIQSANTKQSNAAPAGSSPKQMQQAAIQGMLDRQKARGGPNNGWNKDNLTKAINPKYTPQNIARAQQAVGIKPAINPNSSAPAKTVPTAPAKTVPTAPAKTVPVGQTGDKVKDMSAWAKANPTLAAAAAEKARIRGTNQTDNPLMKDMRSNLPSPTSSQSPAIARLASNPKTLAGNQSLVNNPNVPKAAPASSTLGQAVSAASKPSAFTPAASSSVGQRASGMSMGSSQYRATTPSAAIAAAPSASPATSGSVVPATNKIAAMPKQPTMAPSGGAPLRDKPLWDSYQYDDAYDVVLEYLLDTGHAESVAEAQYIMTELDQESIAEIAEQSIGSKAANAVGHQRAGTLGDDDEIRQNQDATSASIGKMKRGSGAKVTPTLPGV